MTFKRELLKLNLEIKMKDNRLKQTEEKNGKYILKHIYTVLIRNYDIMNDC